MPPITISDICYLLLSICFGLVLIKFAIVAHESVKEASADR